MFSYLCLNVFLSLIIGYFWGSADTYGRISSPAFSKVDCDSFYHIYNNPTREHASREDLHRYMLLKGCPSSLFE